MSTTTQVQPPSMAPIVVPGIKPRHFLYLLDYDQRTKRAA